MPHENIKSSVLNDDHRIQVIWKPAGNTAHAYGEPEPGYVQLKTERPDSEARFPSPEVIELPARHVFESAGSDLVCVRCGLREDEYEVHRPDSIRGTSDDPLMKWVNDTETRSTNVANPTRISSAGLTRLPHNTNAIAVPGKEYTSGENTWSEPCTGFAITLERDDINRLIRMLRRARDSAFVADA
ncbi:MAG TPA: hypothetical protein VKG92_00270 [Flavobacteriales bacterium]|nr:hypothetical protein [Flavobacteriales bacterium]